MLFGIRLPLLDWLPRCTSTQIKQDLIAGLTLAAYAIPVSLAYASLAGLPPQMGLYCYFAGGFGYALFGTSNYLAVGPTSAIALLLGVSLSEVVGTNETRLVEWASLSAILTAGVFALAWLLRLSVLVNFISESILTGFKAGAAFVIAATQFPKLLGIPGGGDDFFERIGRIVQQIGSTQFLPLGIGVVAIVILLIGGRLLPGRPIALGVVLGSLLAVTVFQLSERGLSVVGTIPTGLPRFQIEQFDFSAIDVPTARQLIRLACACFLLSYIESVSSARTYAIQHNDKLDARQELLGLGTANLLAGLFQGFPIAGGLSQTAVNEQGGAKSPLSLVFASLTIGFVLLFLTEFFSNLPNAVLAAVVLVAILGLIDLRELRHLWRISRLDFTAAMIALLGVLCMGVLDGVLVAVLASLGLLLWRSSYPPVAFLGRIPGTRRYSDMARHPDNEKLAGVLAFRIQSSLLYFNAEHVREVVLARLQHDSSIRRVVCDLSNVPYIDVPGARTLRRLYRELQKSGIEFKVAEARATVRDLLRGEGLETNVGTITRHTSLADLVDPVVTEHDQGIPANSSADSVKHDS